MVDWLRDHYQTSLQRSCGLIGLNRSSYYYESKPNRYNEALLARMKEIAATRVRFGYQRIWVMLRREGWHVNKKRVYRLYTDAGMQLTRKVKKKRASHQRTEVEKADRINQKWSMDFVSERTENSQQFRILTIVDQYSRECLATYAQGSLKGVDVARVLSQVVKERGQSPQSITVDNGSEFYSQAMDHWAYLNKVTLDFIRPGKPVENHYIESFNGRLRDECLNVHLFWNIEDAQEKLSHWKDDYNHQRPHGSLDGFTPREFAEKSASKESNKTLQKLEV